MRVVAVSASPRRDSNSRFLLESFLSFAPAEAVVERFEAYRMRVSPCLACGACSSGSCPLEDDALCFLNSLEAADAIVVSFPVYFFGPPAPFKLLVDRSQPLWFKSFVVKAPVKPKRGVLINVGASGSPRMFEACRLIVGVWFNSVGASFEEHLKFCNVEAEGEVRGRKEILLRVEDAAKRFFS